MNVTILNGNHDIENTGFDRYLHAYQVKLHKTGHYVKTYLLREMRIINSQNGSSEDTFADTKEPFDDVRYIINTLRETDLLVWACPLNQGFTSLLLKMVQDRIIGLWQPHVEMHANKWTVSQEYSKIPLMGVIVQREAETSQQDILLNKLIQERIAANLHTVLSFFITTEISVTETVCETFRSFNYQLFIENTCNDFLTNFTIR